MESCRRSSKKSRESGLSGFLTNLSFSSIILSIALLASTFVETEANVLIDRSSENELPLGNSTCPQILRCICLNGDPSHLSCRYITHNEIREISDFYPSLKSLEIDRWQESTLNLTIFSTLKALVDLTIKNSEIDKVSPITQRWKSLKRLKLSGTRILEHEVLCNLSTSIANLNLLDVSRAGLTEISTCLAKVKIDVLKMANNRISKIGALPQALLVLDASNNQLTQLSLPQSLQRIDFSGNPMHKIDSQIFSKLRFINMSNTNFPSLPMLQAPLLNEFYLDNNRLIHADLSRWETPQLRVLSLSKSPLLQLVYGKLPKAVRKFVLTETKLSEMPREFFTSGNLTTLNVSSTEWNCDQCSFKWATPVRKMIDQKICPQIVESKSNCNLGCDQSEEKVFKVRYGEHVVLKCGCHSWPEGKVEWYLYRPRTLLGSFDPKSNRVQQPRINETIQQLQGKYRVLPNGLLISAVDRSMLERYVCVVRNELGVTHQIVKLRMNYHHWYSLDVLDSIFWGSLITSFLVCLLSFILNVIWILSRKSILWWIKRAERLSRVRKMVEAMEKYRSRQMEALHETYTKRVQNVRDNYHYQVEQLRQSYASQAVKFRDFRDAKMENVTSHLESIRDNYNQQMQRVREYGSRRAEQLWESYERQMNRMKMFSLQQRLKVMRQYKVKQRYVNKLLESFQDSSNPEAIRKHEEEVRRALEVLKESNLDPSLEEVPSKEKKKKNNGEGKPLSRTSSYYSLPEFVLDEDGELRPSTITALDFSNREEFNPRNSEIKKNINKKKG
ncbi:unnamed protein product, partial [Mesorhabditis belari]|uniref:Ig-like domain-containing protein n=1 Tax=Mesorhabditis belari TaxID=2138241 RepID=A0AAF3E989_9BILA